jgi:SAM-dependent methyltransferase
MEMGHVFDFQDACAYAQWVSEHRNQWAAALECELMLNLLKPNRGESVLNIGCGTGASTLPLLKLGLNVTGIDPSPYMLDIAGKALGQRVDLYRGFAEDLPFDDNSFNHAAFFISMEFVEDPARAMAEACRVAKDRVFIGFINRYAIKGVQLRVEGLFSASIYNQARFFSVWELKHLARRTAGPLPVSWRTVCQLPNASSRVMRYIEKSHLAQRCPFGTFGGMVLSLVPRLRTRPLALSYSNDHRVLIGGSAPARPCNSVDHTDIGVRAA